MRSSFWCFVLSAAASCQPNWTHDGGRQCGETFCLGEGAHIVDKKSPVEDFNLYIVEFRRQNFQIYEGNNPSPQIIEGSIIEKSGRQVKLGRIDNRVLARISWTAKPWPRFLQISTHSTANSEQKLLQLIVDIVPK